MSLAKKKLEEPKLAEASTGAEAHDDVPEAEPKATKPTAKKVKKAEPKRRRGRGKKVAKEPAKEVKPRAALMPNEVHVYSPNGEVVKSVELPAVFNAPLRPDLIRRAVTAFRANRRQVYGPSPKAGMRHSVRWSGKGHGVSRVPRIRGTMIGAQAPGTRGGRRAHPPRSRTDYSKKVNAKERLKARNGALAALRQPDLVARRGHRFENGRTLPIVVTNELEEGDDNATSARGAEALRALGLWSDVERAAQGTHIRAGRGKMRGRKYRTPKSVLVVATKPEAVARAFRNLPGVDVVHPNQLNAEVLAPGGEPGRLAIFTESALEALRGWSA